MAGKPLRHNKLREYVEKKTMAKRLVEQLHRALIIDTARQLKSRYRRAVTLRPMVSFEDWLLECGSLESTYSERFGYEDRAYRAQRLVREAADITFGTWARRENGLEWFIEGLQSQLECENIRVVLSGIDFRGSAYQRTAESLIGATLTLRFERATED